MKFREIITVYAVLFNVKASGTASKDQITVISQLHTLLITSSHL